jgi:hypothetical protein
MRLFRLEASLWIISATAEERLDLEIERRVLGDKTSLVNMPLLFAPEKLDPAFDKLRFEGLRCLVRVVAVVEDVADDVAIYPTLLYIQSNCEYGRERKEERKK